MSNDELFRRVFGIYAEEFWAYPEEKMLDWLTSNVPDTNVWDLISRQAAIDAIKDYIVDPDKAVSKYEDNVFNYNAGLKSAAQAVVDLPSAQPEQKKGKWIDEKINSYTSRTYCSECGNSAPFICVSGDYYGRYMHGEINKTEFCPHCGADMRIAEIK